MLLRPNILLIFAFHQKNTKVIKKGFFSVTLLAVACVLTLVACKKDVAKTTSTIKSKSSARIGPPIFATFDSLDVYEAFLNAAPGTPISGLPQGYISMKSIIDEMEWQKEHDTDAYFANPRLADSIYEGYGKLLDVLNEDKIVNLYGNLVRIDLHNNLVYSIPSTTTASYDLLLQNPTHNSITQYTTNDEVARILAGIGGCNEPSAVRDKDLTDNNCTSNIRTKKEVRYQNAGIFFSLVAEAKNQKRWLRVWWAHAGFTPGLNMKMIWKPRCRDASGYYNGWASTWSGPGYSGDNKQATFRPYSSTIALTSYSFGSTISGTCGNDWLNVKN